MSDEKSKNGRREEEERIKEKNLYWNVSGFQNKNRLFGNMSEKVDMIGFIFPELHKILFKTVKEFSYKKKERANRLGER